MTLKKSHINSIVYLVDTGFTQNDYQKYGINYLRSKYYIEILDVSNIISVKSHPDHIINNSVKRMSNINDFEEFVVNLESSTVYVDLLNNSEGAANVRTLLRRHFCARALISAGLVPGKNEFLRILKNVIKIQIHKFFPKTLDYKTLPDIAVLSGKMDQYDANFHYVSHKIWCHSFDYERFILTKNSNQENFVDSCAIFLDEDLPSHRDYELLGLKSPIKELDYYPAMKSFLLKFSSVNKLKVKIAGHPRSNPNKLKEHWDGFEVIQGNTNEVVAGCNIVMAHTSTAVSFAVLYAKPIIFLTNNQIGKSWIGQIIKSKSKLLGSDLINIDKYPLKNIDAKRHSYNRKKYNSYINLYIKKEDSNNNPMWKIFSEYLDKNIFINIK
jgi:hypothetical protein